MMGMLFLQSTVIYAKLNCSKNTICIDKKEQGKRIDFYAINKKPYKITVYFNVTKHNMTSTNPLPVSLVLEGNEKRYITSLEYGNKSWRYNYKYDWSRGDYHAKHKQNYQYALPYVKGEKFKVSQSCMGTFTHKGASKYAIDFNMPIGTPVYAARGGIVMDIKNNSNKGGNSPSLIDDGNYVFILHDDGTIGEYWHLKEHGTVVERGQKVEKGQHIGYSGNTGYTRGPHLHFIVKSATSFGKGISFPTLFSTSKGMITCPKKETYPFY